MTKGTMLASVDQLWHVKRGKNLLEDVCFASRIPENSRLELQVSNLVSPRVLSFIVESSRTGKGSEPKESLKLVGALEPVTSRNSKVMKWMFKGVKVFSHVNVDEYVYVSLPKVVLVVGKEGERQRVGSVRGSAVADPSRAVTIMGLGPYES
nr:hypothetical protein [Tanacetum cinerariifolium]